MDHVCNGCFYPERPLEKNTAMTGLRTVPFVSVIKLFSGRISKPRPELIEKVKAWWVRVKGVVGDAERRSAVEE